MTNRKNRGPKNRSFASRSALWRALPERLESRLLLSNTYMVSSTSDNPDTGTLRWAIDQVNANGAGVTSTIDFALPGSGVQTIAPQTPLPPISNAVMIDGTSQSGYAGKPLVEVNGASAGSGADGLQIASSGSTVIGLLIDGFGGTGVVVSGSNDQIGAQGTGNIISGNGNDGLDLTSDSVTGNLVEGNWLGTDATGSTPLANQFNNITVAGGAVAISGNVIVDAGDNGIELDAGVACVSQNFIGTDSSGDGGLGNSVNGIYIDGGSGTVSANTVAASGANGIELDSGSVTIASNFVGTDADGITGLGSSGNGIEISGGSATISGNHVSDNAGDGLNIDGGYISATGNYIGSNGTTFGGNGVTVNNSSGSVTLDDNTFVQNSGDGLLVYAGTVGATGNFIGTDSSDETRLGNSGDGVLLYGGAVTLAGNTIAGNVADGMQIYDDQVIINGNYIGTDAQNDTGLGNGLDGIYVNGNDNSIGDVSPQDANVIADNASSGEEISGGVGNVIRGNSIYANGQSDTSALGITLDGFPPQAAPASPGPNNFQNYPQLDSATIGGGDATITASLDAAPGTYAVDFYANSGLDSNLNAEGQTYLGSYTVTTTMDPNAVSGGSATFSAVVPDAVPGAPLITAAATDSANDTSEFSNYVLAAQHHNNKFGSITNLGVAPSPAVWGQTVTLTAAVTAPGAPGGSVTFFDGSASLGTVDLDSSDQAVLTTSTLAVGPHDLTAQYGGDDKTQPSTSADVMEQIDQASTTTTLISSSSSPQYGDTPTLTATVAVQSPGAGTPSGSIAFYDSSTLIGTESLSGGGASVQLPPLATGPHQFSAVYSGDTNFVGSTGDLNQTVQAATTSTSVTSAPNPSVFGQTVTLTADVSAAASAGIVAGSVTFLDGTTPVGSAALTGGTASVSISALGVSTHSITAQFAANPNFAASVSPSVAQEVDQAATTTTLTSDQNPSVFGQDVTLTATVAVVAPGAGTPTGSITFSDGSQVLSVVPLTGTQATLDIASLNVGDHPITAAYSGDSGFLTSTSATVDQVVNQAATTTSLASSTNPSVYGQSVTFTATVAPAGPGAGSPGGTVTFYDGSDSLATQPLSGGVATLNCANLAVGNHGITAVYNGDGSFASSTSAPLNQGVGTDATATSLTSSANPSIHGTAVTFTASVSAASPGSGTPTGSVTFSDGSTVIGTADLSGGVATFSTSVLIAGDHSINAAYGGDQDYATSNSTLAQQVDQAATTTTLSTSGSPSVSGQQVTFTAAVASATPGTPTGTVTFSDGTTIIGTGSLVGGVATVSTSSLAVGSHSITAAYGGDTNSQTSTSAPLSQQVNLDATSTAVLSSSDPSVFGQPVVYTAMVTPASPGGGVPTGSITFMDGTMTLGSVPLSNDTATFDPSGLSVGNHAVTAIYSGDGSFSSSTGQVIQSVDQDPTSTGVASSLNPSKYGELVVFTATVNPQAPGAGSPSGTVNFYEGTTLLGTGSVSGGQATMSTYTLSVLNHSIVASYGGDSDFLSSNSGQLDQQVVQEQTTVALSSSANPSVFGQSVTFTAAISAADDSAGTPAGTVTFYDGSNSIGAASLNGTAQASFTTSLLGVGSHAITAVYGGDANYVVGTSQPLSQTVNQDPTSTTLASSSNPSAFGQQVTFTASVSAQAPGAGLPTGTVTFEDGSTTLGVQNLSGGAASFTTSLLSVGSHAITAVYSGDGSFKTSSGSVSQQVGQDQATATVASSVNPSVFGQQVTFTATVAAAAPGGGTPTGSVKFFDGSTSIGTANLSGGSASIAVSTLVVGTHPITTVYAGDANFTTATSAALSQVVGLAATSTAVTSSNNPSVFDQSITLTANVMVKAPGAGVAAGTVQFLDGSTVIGTATLSGGNASISVSTLAVGTHSITVSYAGNTSFGASTSPVLSQTVNKDAVNVSVSSSLNPSVVGQSVTFTATVGAASPGAGTPSGMVTFKDGTTVLGTATLSGGKATLSTSALTVGNHSITVSYGSDSNFATGTSAPLVQTVSMACTTTALTSSANPSVIGQALTFTATVAVVSPGSGTPTGTVTFKDGSTVLGTVAISNGVATLSTASLTVGTHSITASYAGDSNYQASTSASLNQSVTQASATTSICSSVNPSVYGQAVTFTATVSVPTGLGTATGTITFKDGNTVLGTATLSGGSASFTISSLAVATHSITAVYGGSATFATSTSSPLSQVVKQDATVTTVTSSASPATIGQSVTFTATVAASAPGSGTPSGTVTFYDGSTVLGTATLSNGAATFSTSSLALGGHTITATYQGSTTFLSSSGSLSQMIDASNCGGNGHGQSCGRSWWQCSSGQNLTGCFNGNSSCTNLGNWLGCTLPNLFGSCAGSNNLCGKTNAQVYSCYKSLCGQSGQANQCTAEILCTALNVYATCPSLGASNGCQYGFDSSNCGLASASCNVGSCGSAFGQSNNCNVNVFQLLLNANARSSGGVCFGGSGSTCSQAQNVFAAINGS